MSKHGIGKNVSRFRLLHVITKRHFFHCIFHTVHTERHSYEGGKGPAGATMGLERECWLGGIFWFSYMIPRKYFSTQFTLEGTHARRKGAGALGASRGCVGFLRGNVGRRLCLFVLTLNRRQYWHLQFLIYDDQKVFFHTVHSCALERG